MNISRLSVDNPVFVNLIMISILVMGVVLYTFQMPKEIFPEFSENRVSITTTYPGASSREVEKNVTQKIEEAVADLDDVDELRSVSQEGISSIQIDISPENVNMAKMLSDIQQAVDEIDDFPEDADDPQISEQHGIIPVITVSIFGDVNLLHLKDMVEDLEDEIKVVPGVADVRISGLPERELWVEVKPETLERYKLTLGDIAEAVRRQNYDLPAGELPTENGEFLIRTVGRVEASNLLKNLPIKTTEAGGFVRLGEVAEIRDWFEREQSLGRFNQRRAVNLTVTKTKSGDVIEVSARIRELVDSLRRKLPPTVDIGVFNDTSVYVKNRLDTLKNSGLQGLLVVFALLFVMLNTRTALMVTLGIPVSFMGALIIMSYTGMTMNMIAMFAMIVVLGLVVDDAVVIGENIYRYYEQGLSPRDAAIKGATEVAWPVVSAVATTIAAFMPLLLIPGTMGVFLGVIPKVVIFALLVSLFEALVILPSHMADFLPRKRPRPTMVRRFIEAGIRGMVNAYGRVVWHVLSWRYVFITLAFAVTTLIVGYSVFFVPYRLFHEFEGTQFYVNIEAPTSWSLDDTENLVKDVELKVRSRIADSEFKSLVTNVGFLMNDFNSVDSGENVAQMIVELSDLGLGRERPIKEVQDDVRQALEPMQGRATINVKELSSGPGGKAIYLLIKGSDLDTLNRIAGEVKSFLKGVPGASDIKDNMEAGKPELQVRLRPEAYVLGLRDADVARQLRDAFWGSESSKFQTEDEDIDVLVKLPEADKARVDSLTRFMITLPGGEMVPLAELADVTKVRGVSRIIRDDRKRAITITGELDQTRTTSSDLADLVVNQFPDLSSRYPGYSLSTERGEVKDIRDSMKALYAAFLLGVLLIYFILGTQFKSYVQPLVVMAAIPFGIDGVLLGHIMMGKTMGILSMIGLVALSGIVVNDSLVLVDFVNQRRSQGVDRRSSLVEAGMIRLRPVLLTSLTTMGGIFFLAFLAKGQAKFLSPMAISIFFGLMAATVITLFIVPSLYAILDDIARFFRKNKEGLVGKDNGEADDQAERSTTAPESSSIT